MLFRTSIAPERFRRNHPKRDASDMKIRDRSSHSNRFKSRIRSRIRPKWSINHNCGHGKWSIPKWQSGQKGCQVTTVFDHWSQTHCMDSLSLFPATKKNPRWKCNSARCEPTRSKERAHTRVATIMFWWDFRGGRWSRIPRPGVCFPHFPKRSRRFPAPGEGPGILGGRGLAAKSAVRLRPEF